MFLAPLFLISSHIISPVREHTFPPIFKTSALLIGGSSVSALQWENKGFHYLKDIINEYGLLACFLFFDKVLYTSGSQPYFPVAPPFMSKTSPIPLLLLNLLT